MVSRVQERVIQQGLRDPRAIAEGAGPSTSTLLGGACSPPTAHWFLLVGRGRQCVVTSIIRIGITTMGRMRIERVSRERQPPCGVQKDCDAVPKCLLRRSYIPTSQKLVSASSVQATWALC